MLMWIETEVDLVGHEAFVIFVKYPARIQTMFVKVFDILVGLDTTSQLRKETVLLCVTQ